VLSCAVIGDGVGDVRCVMVEPCQRLKAAASAREYVRDLVGAAGHKARAPQQSLDQEERSPAVDR
jgi:hypothetical protein